MYSVDIEQAKELAVRIHAGQTDKSGKPYIEHLSRVAGRVGVPEAKVIAWLHDSVEDTEMTVEDIRALFGEDTAHAVDCMTHRPEETYEDYLVRAKSNPYARMVKISDLIDNSNLTRLERVTVLDVERQGKYNRALMYMMG